MTTTAAIFLIAALFFSFAVSVYANDLDSDYPYYIVGEWQNTNDEYSTNTGFVVDRIFNVGKFSSQQAVTNKVVTPDTFEYIPLYAQYSSSTSGYGVPSYNYVLKATDSTLAVLIYNETLSSFREIDSVNLNNYPSATTYKPYIVKFAGDANPTIVTLFNANVQNTKPIFNFYHFNGTNLNYYCTLDTGVTGSGHSYGINSIGYSTLYDKLIIIADGESDFQYTGFVLEMIDKDCHVTGWTNERGQTGGIPAHGVWPGAMKWSDHSFIIIDHAYDTHNSTMVFTEVDTLNEQADIIFFEINETNGIKFPDEVDGSDGFLGYYTCSSGKCNGVSASTKITSLVYDKITKYIFFARETTDFSGLGSNYELAAMDKHGDLVWDTSPGWAFWGSYLHNQCGHSGFIRNVTYFQPVLSSINRGQHFSSYDLPNAICGACQPDCELDSEGCKHIYMACYDTIDGTELVTRDINYGTNLWQPVYNTNRVNFARPAVLNSIISGNFDDTTASNEFIIRDLELDENLETIRDFSFMKTSTTPIVASFGYVKDYDATFASNPSIALWTNTTTRFLFTGQENAVPYYVPDSFKSTCNSRPLCLNFTRSSGVKIQYSLDDYEFNELYARHQCDINTAGDGNWYNWTNWTDIGQPLPGNPVFQMDYCRYNRTGVVTYKYEGTDSIHLFNTTFREVTRSKTYTIIDSYYPYCIDDYSCEDIDNPTTPQTPINDTIILQQYNLTANQTISGAFEQTLVSYNIVTATDRMLFGFLITFAVIIAIVFFGLMLKAPREFYSIGISTITGIMFIAFTILNIFPIWLTILIFIVVAIIGAMVFLRLTGQSPMAGG